MPHIAAFVNMRLHDAIQRATPRGTAPQRTTPQLIRCEWTFRTSTSLRQFIRRSTRSM